MRIREIFQGTIFSRMLSIFLVTGVIPAILIASVLVFFLHQRNQITGKQLDQQLLSQAETSLISLANDRAINYNQFLASQAQTARQLANFLEITLSSKEESALEFQLLEDTYLHQSGWRVNGFSAEVGFLMSPEAVVDSDLLETQKKLSSAGPLFQSIVNTNDEIRSVFSITEDQTLWIYPNRLWSDEEFFEPQVTDLTTRPYYRKTDQVVWSSPYIDVEPVLTVAAPVWVNGGFQGMAGVDFSLETIINETLETRIGGGGFMFLINQQGELVAIPEIAESSLLDGELDSNPGEIFGLSLVNAVPENVKTELEGFRLEERLQTGEPFLMTVNLKNEPAYLVFSPLETVPWYVAVMQPVAEVTKFARQIENRNQTAASLILLFSIITGLGFVGVILVGGLITYRRLVQPIQELARGAEELSLGKFGYRVPQSQEETELSSLTSTFNEMAGAVQNMQEDIQEQEQILRYTLNKREKEFKALTQMTAQLNRQEDLPAAFKEVLIIIQGVIEADFSAVSLIDPTGKVSYTVKAALPEFSDYLIEPAHCEVHISESLVQEVVNTQRNLEIKDLSMLIPQISPEKVDCFREAGIQSAYLMPVITNHQVVAVLTLMWKWHQEMSDTMRGFIEPAVKQLVLLIENSQLRQQSRDYLIIEERRRMARELHDSVTQSLFTLRLMVEGLDNKLQESEVDREEPLEVISQQVGIIQNEMRSLINELRPIQLQDNDFQTALQRHVNSLRLTTGLQVTMESKGTLRNFSRRVAENLNRIVQEAFHNIAEHAQASNVHVKIERDDSVIVLSVEDDGVGFDPQVVTRSDSHSLGLLSMRERAEMLGGALIIRSQPGSGTLVKVKLPV